ncbi:ankyrin repeat domain-containing protein 7-like [Meriones unguiculatus]|uniref:ankyrin repeat domain-containing protein 7-like n=1 Tax=Meriones unguiculatus TaxID=10047 RepID=UPI00293E16A5|nr:ankyrin repeat domain-containing protein 7-like [Meriones unguiculatus]XP_060246697.1 ankyrin repeat domain-containing protein 7-like [Meriones unguiculatus]XP_060246698.1 ankyrin repeat domain-containing protein 7-like [Meriones unguiculatus]XP_060246699.1 ankyrin repeat domain-containing protein 7-like [Meriones unguiculatus]XP_060246700.1 ankyrin repeat domain-containing protein 7-like [Meriones unguiculatus]XP_060246701.1 ankyrin repeat domain-containing protein 7-like [Meriones unguicu
MQEGTNHDSKTQTPSASVWRQFCARLRSFCLGYGCLGYQERECSDSFVPYVPVGPFQRAASVGDWSAVENFITWHGCEVDKEDRRNRTPLHYASVFNQPGMIRLLIKKSCNVNVQDDEGCTPLIKAVEMNNVKCVSVLLKHGANPHIKDLNGNTALHYAAYNGNKAIVSQLLNYNADINAKTKEGFTPFSLAVSENKEKMAQFLKARGANEHGVSESDSEMSLWEESKSMLNMTTQISTELDASTENTSSRVSICRPGCLGTHSGNQDDSKLKEIHLPLLPKCWD